LPAFGPALYWQHCFTEQISNKFEPLLSVGFQNYRPGRSQNKCSTTQSGS